MESLLLELPISLADAAALTSTLVVASVSAPPPLFASSVQAHTHELTKLINTVSMRIGYLHLTASTIVARAHISRHIRPHRQCVTLSLDVRQVSTRPVTLW